VLVWHLDLLKLLPVLGRPSSRIVLFLHGIEAWQKLDTVTRLLLNRVTLLMSNSEHTWSRFASVNPSFMTAPHVTVHLGLGEPLSGPWPRPADRPAVVMSGRLDSREDYKGHRQVIEAWPLVLRQVPGAQLLIAGDGDLKPH